MVMVADHSNSPIFSDYPTPPHWPWTLQTLVLEARRIISYFELPEDKRPPKSLWHSAEKCSKWIEKAFDSKGGGKSEVLTFDDAERE